MAQSPFGAAVPRRFNDRRCAALQHSPYQRRELQKKRAGKSALSAAF